MLSEKQILEIRKHLEKAQNPLFFYDNDVDGFCSYVLLRRFIGRGKGVAVRSHPDIDEDYARKVQELKADYVFVLDRPILGEKFVKEIGIMNLPIVWIDHHDIINDKIDNIFCFNPRAHGKYNGECTSYCSYLVSNRKEDIWIALMGWIRVPVAPTTITSARSWTMVWNASTTATLAAASRSVIELFGPRRSLYIARWQAGILGRYLRSHKGFILGSPSVAQREKSK